MLHRIRFILFLTVLCAGCTHHAALTRFHYAQVHMGVQVRLVVWAPDEPAAERACRAAYARVAELDQSMSDYRVDSELLRLCGQAGKGPVKVSDDLFYVLQKAQEVSRRSDGAFDVTVGPLVALWRKARKTGKLPDPAELANARELTGWRLIELDWSRKTVNLLNPGMRLDLGGIAKGYAGDEALKVLKTQGINAVLFEAGGDIVVGDAPRGKPGWVVQIKDEEGAARNIDVKNCAVSTSGDTEQFVVIEGRRYSHVVDPRTGLGLSSRIQSTVIARRGIDSDSLSTAVCVMGAEKGRELIRQYGARGYIRCIQ
jgi:thiamine biosynthesis lipoprotein